MKAASHLRSRVPLISWTAARRIVQGGVLALTLIGLVLTRGGDLPAQISNLLFRLDPLAVLANSLASRTFLAGSSLVFATLLFTLVFGRAWCGWLCPLGSLLDLFPLRKKKEKDPNFPESWRRFKYLMLVAILLAALLANLTLLVFDPISLFVRTFSTSLWPGIDQAFTALETTLFSVPFLQEPLASLDSMLRPGVLPINPALYRYAFLYGLVLVGVIALNRLAPRFWCRYLCPLGGLLGWVSKLAIFRREVTGTCKDCNLCSKACPVATIRPEKGYASDPSECTMCMECVDRCRLSGNKMTPHFRPSPWTSYDPTRRQALGIFGAAAGSLALLHAQPEIRRPDPHLIQPPGARDNDLLAKCLRCGECLRACPTSGLQPAITEAGFEGFFTPVLVPRIGYCDFACNACGQICPVQAIPPLSLEEKRQTVIGMAYIDQNRCIAWSDHVDCIVCEEMCPLPSKAIQLIPTDLPNPKGDPIKVKLPYVLRDECIGCGICESKCPVSGTAAIRIFSPGPQA